MRNSTKLLKETEELNKWRIIYRQWVGKLSTKKISAFSKPIYMFSTLIVKIFTVDLWISTNFPNVFMERQNIQGNQFDIEGRRRNLES